MNVPTRLVVFALSLTAVFAAAMVVGSVTGPVGGTAGASSAHHDGSAAATSNDGAAEPAPADAAPGGLTATRSGYALHLVQDRVTTGDRVPLRFTLHGPDGSLVTDLPLTHEKPLHLIVASRDLTQFQHVHPTPTDDGTWATTLRLAAAGPYRVLADFTPTGGSPLTLGADLLVAGQYEPAELPAASTSAVVDGYTVHLDGELTPGASSRVELTVHRDGRPVTDLEPYLGAYGHLVALRTGDLAYLHVHPDGEPGDGRTAAGPTVPFSVEVPTPGQYRLFLDFQHRGVVRTAAFTLTTGDATASPVPAPSPSRHEDDGHAH